MLVKRRGSSTLGERALNNREKEIDRVCDVMGELVVGWWLVDG